MKRESWSIALACALGAFIGGLISNQLGGQYLWTLGALIGGLVSYVAIDFNHFRAGVTSAYDNVIAWQPHRLYWQAFFVNFLGAWLISLTFVTYLFGFLFWVDYTGLTSNLERSMRLLIGGSVIWLFLSAISFTWATGNVERRSWMKNDEQYEVYLRRQLALGRSMVRNGHPIAVISNIVYWTVHCLYFTVTNIPLIVRQVGHCALLLAKFIATVFVYVHSARRTICFVDAAIGTAVGYTYGNVLVGVVAGAILGFVNYEVVSVRWLKLAPTR